MGFVQSITNSFRSACKILKEKDGKKKTGRTFVEFIKNRNGEVNQRLFYKLTNSEIQYQGIETDEMDEEEPVEKEETTYKNGPW